MFMSLRIADLNDLNHAERIGYIRADDIVSVIPQDIDLNAAIRQSEPNLVPKMVKVTVVMIRTGGVKFATKESIDGFMGRINITLKSARAD